jgi:hypothetical protein
MNRQAKIFIATVGTPIIVGAVIVGAPAKWSRENPILATGVVYRTETRTPSSWDVARAGLSSIVITTRLGYPVRLRLSAHRECLFTESAVPLQDAEFAALVTNASKTGPSTTPVAKLERCKDV